MDYQLVANILNSSFDGDQSGALINGNWTLAECREAIPRLGEFHEGIDAADGTMEGWSIEDVFQIDWHDNRAWSVKVLPPVGEPVVAARQIDSRTWTTDVLPAGRNLAKSEQLEELLATQVDDLSGDDGLYVGLVAIKATINGADAEPRYAIIWARG